MKKTIPCDKCKGSGKLGEARCPKCCGAGSVVERTNESGMIRQTKVLNEA